MLYACITSIAFRNTVKTIEILETNNTCYSYEKTSTVAGMYRYESTSMDEKVQNI